MSEECTHALDRDIIARYLGFDDQAEDDPMYDVGILGNSRVRAVAHYGNAGFEVSWQIVPADMNDDAAQRDLAALERAAKGQVA